MNKLNQSLQIIFVTIICLLAAAQSISAATFLIDTTSNAALTNCDLAIFGDCSRRGAGFARRYGAAVSIGSTVFNDTNNNGIFNSGETGIPGLAVQLLYDADNNGVISGTELTNPFATMNTDSNGNYFFSPIPTGNYQVRIPNPTGYVSSTPTNTTDSRIDNDDNGTQTGGAGGSTISPIINLFYGTEPVNGSGANDETGQGSTLDDAASDSSGDMTVDFGFFKTVSLGDFVFRDSSSNGRQDAGEMGVANVRVQLYDGNGTEINVGPDGILGTADDAAGGVLTTGSGAYLFQGLPPGTYSVGFTLPTGFGYAFTVQDAAIATDATDSDANPATGRTGNYTLNSGASNLTVDAGVVVGATAAGATARGRVTEANGRGIFRALVTMTDAAGNQRVAYTNQQGYYNFEDVAGGQVYIFTAQHRRYQFDQPTQVQFIGEETNQINFTGTQSGIFRFDIWNLPTKGDN